MKKNMYCSPSTYIHNMSSNNLIRVNLVIDKDSKSFPSEKEWLNKNGNFEYARKGVRFEMHENYPALVTNIQAFKIMDIARQMSEGRGLLEILTDFTWVFNLDLCEELPINFNVTDLYLIPGENCYYLDRECSNAAVLIFNDPLCPIPELMDRILKSFKVNVYCDGNMLLIDCDKESHDMAMGRMRRIAALCFIQMGIPTDHHMMNDKYISYVNDNNGFNAIYIY